MKAIQKEAKYVEWVNADVMHKTSKNWLSDLLFVKDEQLFFEDLIKSYTLQLIDTKHFPKSKKIIEMLSELQKETKKLINTIKVHESGLTIMVDKIDQLKEEENYKNEHRKLTISVSEYFENYKSVKKQLFKLIKTILKQKKQKFLLQ